MTRAAYDAYGHLTRRWEELVEQCLGEFTEIDRILSEGKGLWPNNMDKETEINDKFIQGITILKQRWNAVKPK
jgi:hypothetical protein